MPNPISLILLEIFLERIKHDGKREKKFYGQVNNIIHQLKTKKK